MACSVILHLSLHLCCDRVQIPLGHREERVEEVEEEVLCLGAGMYSALDLDLFLYFHTRVSVDRERARLLLLQPGSSDHCVMHIMFSRADLIWTA